jgi:hypothetical protein
VLHSDERVEALARFQQACILHALRFPALRRLVYSTCRCAGGWMGGRRVREGSQPCSLAVSSCSLVLP